MLKSIALTADSFYRFLLGPLALENQRDRFVRLDNVVEGAKEYYRLYVELEPGIGFSERDELILWIDSTTMLAYRMHITLEGYKTTAGAQVDVTFLDYENVQGFQLPVEFYERVSGPIAIHAHRWEAIGLDINRGLDFSSVHGPGWQTLAAPVAQPR